VVAQQLERRGQMVAALAQESVHFNPAPARGVAEDGIGEEGERAHQDGDRIEYAREVYVEQSGADQGKQQPILQVPLE
jgi:hypothetical protein